MPHTTVGAFDALKIDVQGAEEYVYCAERRIRFAPGSAGYGSEFSPEHLRGAGTDPKDFLVLLGSLKMELFEIDLWGQFQRLSNPEDYIRRIARQDMETSC